MNLINSGYSVIGSNRDLQGTISEFLATSPFDGSKFIISRPDANRHCYDNQQWRWPLPDIPESVPIGSPSGHFQSFLQFHCSTTQNSWFSRYQWHRACLWPTMDLLTTGCFGISSGRNLQGTIKEFLATSLFDAKNWYFFIQMSIDTVPIDIWTKTSKI